ncbi:MAG TPA: dTMP kinase [Acidimicrobiales bacterium]|nr:dTMP kinase [Acidimicrobiales bacterium]
MGTAPGRFVAFEGGEGTGKSTQARILAEHLGAVLTREPGGTPIGARVREIVLAHDENGLVDRAEALLMAADRAQHVAEVIRPALAAGRHVVTDRFLGSSLAYQGHGRGLPVDEIRGLSLWATAGLEPDLVVLLDVDEAEAQARIGRARDRLEKAGSAFHRAVADGFRALAEGDQRWVLVPGGGTVAEVTARVQAVVADRLALG